ncbi:MAG: class I SAM-dependent methyltransferase, partial [Polyangiaceae bacterium]
MLDLGCGNGAIGKAVEGRFGASVVCADIENFLEYDVPFHKITGKLEFADDSFDFAMFNDVLHHIPKPSQLEAILEAVRVARKLLIFDDRADRDRQSAGRRHELRRVRRARGRAVGTSQLADVVDPAEERR